MKKLILLSLVAMSILVARDCRYEERELNMLIQQYDDLQDEYEYKARRGLGRLTQQDAFEAYSESSDNYAKYKIRSKRLNQRIEQQKQRLNNCRNGK